MARPRKSAEAIAVTIADEPLNCVALGTGRALEHMAALSHVLVEEV